MSRRTKSAPKQSDVEFTNVEFLDTSLGNPLNVLRAKLKDLSELPDDLLLRRVLIISDLWGTEGRELDIVWSSTDDEPPFQVQDSLVSLLSRVHHVIVNGED